TSPLRGGRRRASARRRVGLHARYSLHPPTRHACACRPPRVGGGKIKAAPQEARTMPKFEGFPKDFYAFFRELKQHNEREWFEDNKQRFRDHVRMPMSAFIEAMAPELKKISKHFVADPRPNGGSMFRIYRDVRFARDKRPYKEHAACHFRHVTAR